jgi:hypothetical protein
MRRIFFLACCLASTAALAAPVHHEQAGNLSASQIINKNVAARGGLKAWLAVNTLTLSGQLEAGGKKNTELPFVMKMKRPHMSRLEIRFEGQTAAQIYDGQHGWKIRPYLGRNDAEPFSPSEARAASDWQDLDGPLMNYEKKGTKVKFDGMATVEKHKTYILKLTMKDGTVRHVWIDAATFLERKIDGEPRVLDGKLHNVSIYYRDYKTEHGLKMPHTFETVVEGTAKDHQSHRMHIDLVKVNQPMEDALFARPQLAMASTTDR